MKILFSFLLLWVACVSCPGGELVRGVTLTDGQTLTAADLHNLIDTAAVGADFYTSKTRIGSLPGGYDFLVYDAGSGFYRRVSATSALYANTNLYLSPALISAAPAWARLTVYNPTNNAINVITLSNVLYFGSTNISAAALVLATTNGPTLPAWSGAFSGLQTTNRPHVLAFGTNGGGPQYITLSNFESAVAADLGTNFSLPYTYDQVFRPWRSYGVNIYGTNTAGPGLYQTNDWGVSTNFPITDLWMSPQTNTATLLDTDTLPIHAGGQGTNTSVTLGGLYQYLTNKNTLPPYTQARVQFSGYAANLPVFNDADSTGELIHAPTNVFTAGIPYAVSVITNASQIQVAEFQTNSLFYVVAQATNNSWLRVFTNRNDALGGTNYLNVTGAGSGTANRLLYLTNFTSFNADVTQYVQGPNTVLDGVYEVWFRTNAANNLYYVTGTTQRRSDGAFGWVALGTSAPQVDKVRVITTPSYNAGLTLNYPLVQVLINPE